jgi:hypothetical protein
MASTEYAEVCVCVQGVLLMFCSGSRVSEALAEHLALNLKHY